MSTALRFFACAINQTALDWKGNEQRITALLAKAKQEKAQVVCTPEFSICGYGCEDAFFGRDVADRAWTILERLALQTQGMLAVFGLPIWLKEKLYNAVALCFDGKIIGLVPKQHLANDGVHYEARWFDAWQPGEVCTFVSPKGESIPFGDWLFSIGGVCFGIEICRDAWVADRSGISLAQRGAHVILNPTASHFAFAKVEKRQALVKYAADHLGVAFVFANLLGNDAGKILYDGDVRIAAPGGYYTYGKRFGFDDSNTLLSTVALDDIIEARAQEHPTHKDTIVIEHSWRTAEKCQSSALDFDAENISKEEAFTRVVTMGLFDYLRKSRMQGFVLNLSGGADSTACACLVRLMIDLAVQELGIEGFKKRLSHIGMLEELQTVEMLTKNLLCGIYQGTIYSSDLTEQTAKLTAQGLGATFYEWPIQHMVTAYHEMAEQATGESLDWEKHNLALQNIQARVRGPAAWLIANMKSALLLSTGNRSEAAVGYTTMDGDTCGGLSPIGGVDKAFILNWLQWLEKQGPEGLAPMPYLHHVNQLEPSAELRPDEQRDEDELMPYKLLTEIEDLAIRCKYSPKKVYTLLKDKVDYSPEQLKIYVRRFYTLWSQNQWKRERYAPAFHLDDKNLDPKTWCRYPILSGGFQQELEELG